MEQGRVGQGRMEDLMEEKENSASCSPTPLPPSHIQSITSEGLDPKLTLGGSSTTSGTFFFKAITLDHAIAASHVHMEQSQRLFLSICCLLHGCPVWQVGLRNYAPDTILLSSCHSSFYPRTLMTFSMFFSF